MFFLKNFFCAAVFLVFAAGCSTPEPALQRFDSSRLAPPEVERERAEQLSRNLAPCRIRAAVMAADKFYREDLTAPEEFVERVRLFGFNRIYLVLEDVSALDDRLRGFLRAAGNAGLPVEPVIRQVDFLYSFRGNAFLREFRSGSVTLSKMAEALVEFNREQPDGAKFAGAVVEISPHLFTINNFRRPKNLLYAWSEQTWGPGMDNDMMMKATIAELKEIAAILTPLSLTVSVPDFYHELAQQKKLTVGDVNDFLAVMPQHPTVLLRDSGNKPSEALEMVENELAAAKVADSVVVGINLANHTSVTEGAFRRRNWQDFSRAMGYLVKKWKEFPAFAGVAIGPFLRLELIQEEE